MVQSIHISRTACILGVVCCRSGRVIRTESPERGGVPCVVVLGSRVCPFLRDSSPSERDVGPPCTRGSSSHSFFLVRLSPGGCLSRGSKTACDCCSGWMQGRLYWESGSWQRPVCFMRGSHGPFLRDSSPSERDVGSPCTHILLLRPFSSPVVSWWCLSRGLEPPVNDGGYHHLIAGGRVLCTGHWFDAVVL